MSSWGKRRRNLVLFVFFFGILIMFGTFLFTLVSKPATCFDGKQNGDEEGVDCGGSCELVCEGGAINLNVQWQRFFEVVPGTYNVMAYVENLNPDMGVREIRYSFILYDDNNFTLDTRAGKTKIGPKEIAPIFESAMDTGRRIPRRVVFEIEDDLVWHKMEPKDRYVEIRNQNRTEVDEKPRITAEITNTSINRVRDIVALVIVYDDDGNVLTTSRTLIEKLDKDETRQIVYTWPQPFPRPDNRAEIILLYD